MKSHDPLRVAFVAGTLGQGGAEKQLTYMVRALLQQGASVRVYTLTRGEHYEANLKALGAEVLWLGRFSNPWGRLPRLIRLLRQFRPHVVQSAHFYTNLYSSMAASFAGAVAIGAIRSDLTHDMKSNPFWGNLLLRRAGSLIANSRQAERNAHALGVPAESVSCLPNAIDLAEFDEKSQQPAPLPIAVSFDSRIVVASVGRLVPQKRVDRFIDVLAMARRQAPELFGLIVGDGPEGDRLRSHARANGLFEQDLVFLGRRDDVPAVLRHAHVLAMTSDHEGFPNVLLEAMAGRLPVIATPAGDSAQLVRDGVTGFVQPYDDIDGLVARLIELARSAPLRTRMGQEGRMQTERDHRPDDLADRLFSIYLQAARHRHSRRLLEAL